MTDDKPKDASASEEPKKATPDVVVEKKTETADAPKAEPTAAKTEPAKTEPAKPAAEKAAPASVMSRIEPLSAWAEETPKPLPKLPEDGSPCAVRELPPVLNWFGKAASLFADNIFSSLLWFAAAAFVYIGANYFGFKVAELLGDPASGIGSGVVYVFRGIAWATGGFIHLDTIYLILIFLLKVLVPAITAGVLGAALLGMYGRMASGVKTNYISMVVKSIGMLPSLTAAYLVVYGYLYVTLKVIGPQISGTSAFGLTTSVLGSILALLVVVSLIVIVGVSLIATLTRLFSVFTIHRPDPNDKSTSFSDRYIGLMSELKKLFWGMQSMKFWWRFKWVIYFFAWFAIVPLMGWFVMNMYRDKATLGSSMSNAVRRLRIAPIPATLVGIIVTALALLGSTMFSAHLSAISNDIDTWKMRPDRTMTVEEKVDVKENGKSISEFSFTEYRKVGDKWEKQEPDRKYRGVEIIKLEKKVKDGDKDVEQTEYYVANSNYDADEDKETRNNLTLVGFEDEVSGFSKYEEGPSKKLSVKQSQPRVLFSDLLIKLLGMALIFPLAGVFLGVSYNEMNYAIEESSNGGSSYASLLFAIIVAVGIVFAML
ncbi:MAG: hypothetical protein ABIH86_07510 [Planctomycetota bacterium]